MTVNDSSDSPLLISRATSGDLGYEVSVTDILPSAGEGYYDGALDPNDSDTIVFPGLAEEFLGREPLLRAGNESSSHGLDVGDEGTNDRSCGGGGGVNKKKTAGIKHSSFRTPPRKKTGPSSSAASDSSGAAAAPASGPACNPQEASAPPISSSSSTTPRTTKAAKGGRSLKKKGSLREKLAGKIKSGNHSAAATSNKSHADARSTNGASNRVPPTNNKIATVAPTPEKCNGTAEARTARQEGGPLIEESFSDVNEKYDVDTKELGSGQYGIVRKCTDRTTGEAFAVKTIKKSRVGQIDVLRQEVRLLREVSHPNIIQLVDVLEDKDDVHLVTELATGGELFDRIIAKKNSPGEGCFSEREAAVIIRQILDAIAYCHDEKDIVHRDIKPENFLFSTDNPDASIKIIDFGYATRHVSGKKTKPLKDDVGTPLYNAPELHALQFTPKNKQNGYDRKCDVWSVGIIAYTLLAGYPPYNGTNEQEIAASVLLGRFRFIGPPWENASTESKDFICKVLKKDPKLRIGAKEARDHPWIKKFGTTPVSKSSKRPTRRSITPHDEDHIVSSWGGKIPKSDGVRPRRRLSAANFAY